MENNKLKDLISKVQKWFYDRNLHTQEPNKQFLKLYEEIGELSRGIAEKDEEVTKDSIGGHHCCIDWVDSSTWYQHKRNLPRARKIQFLKSCKDRRLLCIAVGSSFGVIFQPSRLST